METAIDALSALPQDEESTGARGRGGRRSRGGGLARGDSSLLNSSADNSMQETPVATPPGNLSPTDDPGAPGLPGSEPGGKDLV